MRFFQSNAVLNRAALAASSNFSHKMSYSFGTFRGKQVDTPENQNISVQHSTYGNLRSIVLEKAPQDCCHDFLNVAKSTDRWKHFWDEKICLLWLQPEETEEKWADIILWFKKRGTEKSYEALYAIWSKASNEVTAMQDAAEQYQDLHVASWIRGIGAPWEWMSARMKDFGAKESWTPGKVEYAWHHGVSALVPHIFIVCGPLPPHLPVLDAKADAGGEQFL